LPPWVPDEVILQEHRERESRFREGVRLFRLAFGRST
jgi:hypothetical protein